MFNFIAEYLFLAFTIGGIVGATVALHLAARHTRYARAEERQHAHADELLAARVREDRT
ncbi:MAG: hypothetical protein LBV36_02590 [Chromatiales bacterium]|jgi:gas vesicle protein|nr:hypothetical protein [Chromatiales bacterium]